jgi:glycerate 2-kinase
MSSPDPACVRQNLRSLFDHALKECSVASAFERHIACERGVLRIGDDLYALADYSRVFVVSIGKAAHSTAEALASKLGRDTAQGIIVGPVPPKTMIPGFTYFTGGHPLPTADSVRAAESILYQLARLEPGALVIFLLSGGGSALAEKPLYDEISLDDLIKTYRVLVHSGAPIAEINAIRKHLSALKGGRMAAAAAKGSLTAATQGRQVSILVSDVPDNALDSLASGPTMPDTSTVDDCYRIAVQYDMVEKFPEPVARLFRTGALEETPKSDDPAFVHSRWWTVLSNETARNAASEYARFRCDGTLDPAGPPTGAAGGPFKPDAGGGPLKPGFGLSGVVSVVIDNSCDDWDYAKAADYLLGRLREMKAKDPGLPKSGKSGAPSESGSGEILSSNETLRVPHVCPPLAGVGLSDAGATSNSKLTVPHISPALGDMGISNNATPRVCLISGGEITVRVTNPEGVGGRNQQFALYCATKIAGENIAVLSAGTDGIDGASTAAGAVVDGTTVSRAMWLGLDLDKALSEFNSFAALDALGDAIITGPTGTNVRDLRVLVAW